MKTFALSIFALGLLLTACEPDPIPELREQIHGQWGLSVNGDARYSPIFSYSFYYPTGKPSIPWIINIESDGTATIETDSTYHTTWQHRDRDHINMHIPAGILLPNLGSWECSFLKYENYQDRQYLIGDGSYATDTAVVNEIFINMYWELTRIQ